MHSDQVVDWLAGVLGDTIAVAIVGGVRDGKLGLAGGAQSYIAGKESKDATIVGMTVILLLQAELSAASGHSP